MTPRVDLGELALRPAQSATVERPLETTLTPEVGAPDFGDIFARQIADTSHLTQVAREKTEALARGASDDLHGTMISVKEADISMKLVGTVRNRLLDAFHELWRINI